MAKRIFFLQEKEEIQSQIASYRISGINDEKK